jgi:hypothetical protein
MTEREVLFLLGAIFFFVGAIFPKPIMLRGTGQPHPNQTVARFCAAGLGLVALLLFFLERNSK